MPPADRARHRGRRTARLIAAELASELREARLGAGLSQAAVARASGLSQSRVSRTEGARRPSVGIDELSRHAAALGLRMSVRVFPEGAAVRDAGQLRLLGRLETQIRGQFRWRREVAISGPGDYRAWDVVLDGPGSIGIDAETRLRDVQAVQRRCELKWRDSGVDRVVLLVADTRHNAAVLREHRVALASTFPACTAEVMSALRRGLLPGRNGLVVL